MPGRPFAFTVLHASSFVSRAALSSRSRPHLCIEVIMLRCREGLDVVQRMCRNCTSNFKPNVWYTCTYDSSACLCSYLTPFVPVYLAPLHTHIDIHPYTHTHKEPTHTHRHTYIDTHTQISLHCFTCVCIYVFMYTWYACMCIYAYVHICT